MLRHFRLSTRHSRWLRLGVVIASAAASVATFGGENGWSMHTQLASPMASDVALTTGSPIYTDVLRAQGAGSGAREVNLDFAAELELSAAPSAPVAVRLRFVPMNSASPVQEAIRYVTERQSFMAVDWSVSCESSVPCIDEGTVEVTPVTPSELGGSTLSLHWVATASLLGRGPAAPADATLRLTQP